MKEQIHTATEVSGKVGIGFLGSFGALTIDSVVGVIVGILTAIYMVLQIEAAWRRRKEGKK